MGLSIRRKLFLSHLLAVLVVSGTVGSYFYLTAVHSLTETIQGRLESAAALAGQVLDAADLDSIRAPADRAQPIYQHYLGMIRSFGLTNPDIAFIYVMRHHNGRVQFVIDSDPSEDQAEPGREYTELTPALLRGFQAPSADDRVYSDAWGAFMSGYAPLRNGNGEYLVGLDMRADELARKLSAVRTAGGLSLAASVLLALLFSRVLSDKVVKPVRMLIARCRAIAKGEPDRRVPLRSGDELEELVDAFNAMSRELTVSRAQAEEARRSLEHARDLLELRVAERTRDLMQANERLLHEVAERARAEEQLALAARADPLTGLMNRRAMLEQLDYQVARFQRNDTPFVLILADLDHFKSVNDTFGHDAGDQTLIEISERLKSGLRAQDLVARWGGEEFLILLPDTDLEGGLVVAEDLREAIAAQVVGIGGETLRLTLSLGVAGYCARQSLNECIKAADTALYRAKVQGRNRVVAATSRGPEVQAVAA
ncbi:MAG: diguanylate cyclase [Bdellovibrio bacteriovorus]